MTKRGDSRPGRLLHVAAVEYTARHLLLPQLDALRAEGFDVAVACAPERGKFEPEILRFDPTAVHFPKYPEPFGTSRAIRQLNRLVRRSRPDVVHFHTPTASIPGRLGLRFVSERPRTVLTVHGYLHDWEDRGIVSRLSDSIEKRLSSWTDLTLFQSKEDLELARQRGYRGRLLYLGNGVGDEWFTGPRRAFRPPGSRTAVCVARLIRMKGVLDLLEAMRHVSGLQLVLVGYDLANSRDPAGEEARRIVAAHRLPVHFAGRCTSSEVLGILSKADFFVLPSWREGVPRSMIEAMATGLPVVTTSAKGNRELAEDGANGWVVPPRRPDRLADALRHAVACSVDHLVAMSEASFARVNAGYVESAVLARLIDAYRQLGVEP